MLAEDASASRRTHRILFTPAKRTSLADAAAAVFSSPPITASANFPDSTTAVTPTSSDAGLVTPTSSKPKPTKVICAVDGCTRKGVSFGKCARHHNEELAAARRSSKRAPKRSKVDIMMEFERKSEIPQRKSEIPAVNRAKNTSMDEIEENKSHGDKLMDEDSTVAEATDSVSALPKPKEIECDWRETIDATSGKPYYYHIRTNEVTWTKPSSLIAAEEVKAIVASTPSDYTANYHASTEDTALPLDMPARAKSKNWGQGKWRGISQVNTIYGTKFKAAITVAGRTRHIGTFDTSEQAIRAYAFVRNVLTNCGLDPMDREGRAVVFDAAKVKAKEVAIMLGGGSDVAATHSGKSAVQVQTLIAAEEVKAIVASTPSDYTANYHASTEDAALPLDMPSNTWGQGQWRGISQVNTKFKAAITVAGRTRHIGTFDTSEQAIRAYAFVRNILTNCGLDPMDREARTVVFDAAKVKAKEVAIMVGSGSGVAATHDGKSAVQVQAKRPMQISDGVSISPSGKYSAELKVNKAALVTPGKKGAPSQPPISMKDASPVKKATVSKKHPKPVAKAPVVDSLPRGVRKRESGNYEAQIWYGDRKRYIGCFTTKERAGAAFQVVRKALDEVSSQKVDETWFARLKEDAWRAAQEVSKSSTVTVGARVGIYWDLDRVYYPATVTAIFKNLATLLYDDGHIDSIDLTKDDFKRLRYEIVPQKTALMTPDEKATPSMPATSTKDASPAKKANVPKKHPKPVKKPPAVSHKKKYKYQQVTCEFCGRHFGIEGLKYHLSNNVCRKGKDTSKSYKHVREAGATTRVVLPATAARSHDPSAS